MPEKEFQIWIDSETVIRVTRETVAGRLVRFAVVLIVRHEGHWLDIGRFDTAHGIPHQDVMGRRAGLLQKIWLDDLSPRQAFHHAIEIFKTDHERIKQHYFHN